MGPATSTTRGSAVMVVLVFHSIASPFDLLYLVS
jgi:hypothetical protein